MSKKRILIVDDEPDVLMLTSLRLRKFDYEILTAINGRDAFEVIQKEKPDLVLLDLIIPIAYGTEICRRVKSDENLKHIPIILYTAHGEVMIDEKAKSFGADDYIAKPFDAEELTNKIERLLTAPAVCKTTA
ncbi:MAG: response regulator [Phycisphaerae bacterium]|nr:response regulator [Phycisphaerae bacterium]